MEWSDGGTGAVNAVVTTGIYCRAGCAGRPHPANTRRLRSPVEAEVSGYRACLRCRPDRLPVVSVSPEHDPLVAAALLLIADGFLDRRCEADLGREIGVSGRHLRRLFADAVGATPSQVAASRRSHFARLLLDDTDLPITEVAFAAGFGSVRRMNETMRTTFRSSPSELRRRRRPGRSASVDGGIRLRLRAHRPVDGAALLGDLARRSIPGVERVESNVYRRSTEVCGHAGVVEIRLVGEHDVEVIAHLPAMTGLIDEVGRCRRLLGLDQIDAELPGAWSHFETEIRRVVAEAVGDRAPDVLGELARRHGDPVPGAGELGVEFVFPSPERLALVTDEDAGGAVVGAVVAEAAKRWVGRPT